MKIDINLTEEDINRIADKVSEKIRSSKSCQCSGKDEIFNVKQLAEYLQVSEKWVYEKVQFKKIPHVKFSDNGNNNKKGALRFKKKLIDNWLTEHDIPVLVNSNR